MRGVVLIALFALLVTACGDYDTGYDDGYDGAKKNSVLFGRDKYNQGYKDGAYDADCDYWKKHDREKFGKYCR